MFLGYVLREELQGDAGYLALVHNVKVFSKVMRINLHFHQQCVGVPLVSHPYQSLRLSVVFVPVTLILALYRAISLTYVAFGRKLHRLLQCCRSGSL